MGKSRGEVANDSLIEFLSGFDLSNCSLDKNPDSIVEQRFHTKIILFLNRAGKAKGRVETVTDLTQNAALAASQRQSELISSAMKKLRRLLGQMRGFAIARRHARRGVANGSLRAYAGPEFDGRCVPAAVYVDQITFLSGPHFNYLVIQVEVVRYR